ncbi:MAG TPA: M23 family metallopeptidase [Candidatus Gastranaerophilales bacterium]|nr:M23 family metallopeptidase [Candidatus Gastranaerophilales bacterium]
MNFNMALAVNPIVKREFNPPIELKFPLSCQLEENCWIVNYPDIELSDNIADYMRGKIAYNNNKGVDIAVQTLLDVKNGAPVLSAQDGTVIFTRNNIDDNFPLEIKKEQKSASFCGNSVVIEHNNGWKTVYCHLKKGSVKVKPGDFVNGGDKIAEVGFSGKTEFPHLYFAVLYDGKYFDPFSGYKLSEDGEKKNYKPFWSPFVQKKLIYRNVIVTNIGISSEEPTPENVKNGKYENIEIFNDAPIIYLWISGFHFNKGDLIKISLKNPDQQKIVDDFSQVKSDNMEQLFSFKKLKTGDSWKSGVYSGKYEIARPGSKVVYDYNFDVEIKELPVPVNEEELRKKELLEKLKLKRRKVIIFYKLSKEKKLPDTYKENKFKYEFK